MLPKHTPQRGSRWSASALVALSVFATATAQEAERNLDPLIVSALRIPQEATTVTSAVTLLDPEALQNQGLFQFREALNQSPGVISTSTGGQTGALGSLFIRGTTTAYSQVVVDGMRLSDSTTPLGNVLSASRTYNVGRIEILRGPQGSGYGGESIGGILWVETPRGSGAPRGSVTAEAGSFNSYSAHGTYQGTVGDLSYFLSGGHEQTDNDGPNQDFRQWDTALRVEGQANSIWSLGMTYRANDSHYDDSGNSNNYLDSQLGTIYANGKISDCWTARYHAGFQQEFYDSDSNFGNFGTDLRAGSISTDHEITLQENLRLLAGAFYFQNEYKNTIGTLENRSRYGAHAALEWNPIDDLTTTAALRWEDYDAYGSEATWRVGSIYRFAQSGTSLRGGIGTSFRSPSYLDLFGSSFGAGNPDLKAESSLGWDLGVTQQIGANHSFETTFFHNRITDQIQSFPTPPVNIPGDTTTDGVEFGLLGNAFENALNYRLAWTYLHRSLSDQPKHALTGSIDWKVTGKALIGLGATSLTDHSWGGDPVNGYTVARIYGSYQLTDKIRLHGRVENALNEEYELGSFFGAAIQGAGTGAYAGVTVDW